MSTRTRTGCANSLTAKIRRPLSARSARHFDALGFVSRHVGGQGAPDGVSSKRPSAGSRTASWSHARRRRARRFRIPTPPEAAKWRESYGGDYALIIGASFGEGDTEFTSELALHHVSARSVEDLVAALRVAADLDQLRAVFAPGYAEDHLPALVWERTHGLAKRGSTAVSTREEIRAAFAHLTSPLVCAARWLDEAGEAIVVIHA